MPEKRAEPNAIEVWGANVHDLLNIEGVTVKLVRWKGCDDSCVETDHDPVGKVFSVKFPKGTSSNKVKDNITDYTLPTGQIVRVVNGGNFYDKLIVFDFKNKK
uniref:Uncharacterized protein n=1 Tax=Candidatus Methanomethylicus mesodigestus TaxID=1867258 RepID=A0A7C3F5Y9_9CREN